MASFLQALPWVGMLIALIFFIYGVVGMQVSLLSPKPAFCMGSKAGYHTIVLNPMF
jgi:hypothetical protein